MTERIRSVGNFSFFLLLAWRIWNSNTIRRENTADEKKCTYASILERCYARVSKCKLRRYWLREEKLPNRKSGVPRHGSIVFLMVWRISVYHRKLRSCVTVLYEHADRNHEILSVYELRILECCRQGHAQRLEIVDLFLSDLYECLIHKISVNQQNPRCNNSNVRDISKCELLARFTFSYLWSIYRWTLDLILYKVHG